MQQIPLQIELKTDATFANFIVGDNQVLLEQLKSIANGEPDFIYFYGESGSGRSHLLQAIIQSQNSALNAYIPMNNPMLVPQMLEGMGYFDCVCLDDFEQVSLDPKWQTAIFNLYNQLKDEGKSLIIAGNQAPANLTLELADLKSRLSAMFIHKIVPLSDQDKLDYIQHKAHEKGMLLKKDVAQYLISRQQRDLPNLNQMINLLDQASLQAQRKLTIPFVKSVLEQAMS